MIAMSGGRHFGAGRHFHADLACLSRRHAQTHGHEDREENCEKPMNRPQGHQVEHLNGNPVQNKATRQRAVSQFELSADAFPVGINRLLTATALFIGPSLAAFFDQQPNDSQ
jgi:hypothetical protein